MSGFGSLTGFAGGLVGFGGTTGFPGGETGFVREATAAGYTPPAGATAVLLDFNPAEYSDVDSVSDTSGAMAGTWTKVGAPTFVSRGGHTAALINANEGWKHSSPVYETWATAKTIYAVVELSATSSDQIALAIDNGSSSYQVLFKDGANAARSSCLVSPVNSSDAVGSMGTGSVYVLSASVSTAAGTNVARLDGSAGSGAAVGSSPSMSGYETLIGHMASLSLPWKGWIYRLIVDDAAYSATLETTLQGLYA